EAFDHRSLLVGREEGPFSSMTENDQAFDLVEAAEPGAEPLDRGVVDLAVAGKRGHGRGDETSEIKGFHVGFLRIVSGARLRSRRGRIASDLMFSSSTKLSAVVPAKAGTHSHRAFEPYELRQIARTRRMGPRFRGDDSNKLSKSQQAQQTQQTQQFS